MKKKNLFNYLTINEFRQNILTIKDFPTLLEYIVWADKHRENMIFSFNHLVYIIKITIKRKKYIENLFSYKYLSTFSLQNNLQITYSKAEQIIEDLMKIKIIKPNENGFLILNHSMLVNFLTNEFIKNLD